MNKNILILSTDKYPNGDAGAVRTHILCKLFREIGYETTVVSLGKSTNFNYKIYDGVQYISLRKNEGNTLAKAMNHVLYLYNLKKLVLNKKSFSMILITNSIPINAFFYIKKYAKRSNVQLLHDSVEWFSAHQFRFGKWSWAYVKNDLFNKKWIDGSFRVIAISSYLYKNFSQRNIKTIRVPAILDTKDVSTITNCKINSRKVTIVYAGTPGKKDYLKEVIHGLGNLTSEKLNHVEFRVIGITVTQLIEECGVSKEIMEKVKISLKCMGRVPREIVLENLQKADFTVLLRNPKQRYSKAGFPTKVVESMTYSTPVICNLTSDLDMYIHDMVNGIIVKECTAQSFKDTLERVLILSNYQINDMKKAARETAETYFDYRYYKKDIKKLLDVNEGERC